MFKQDLMKQYDGKIVRVSMDRTKDPTVSEGYVYVGRVRAFDTNLVTLQPYRYVRDNTDVEAARVQVAMIRKSRDRRRERPLTLGRAVIASIDSLTDCD